MAGPSWSVLSAELKTRGRLDLKRDLTRAVRAEGQPAVAAVQAAWRSVQVTGSSRGGTAHPDVSRGLRGRVAAASRVQATQAGVRITVDGKKVDPVYGNSLAWYLNGSGRRPWRHPVFGRTANPQDWQQQQGQEVFFQTLREHGPRFRAAIERAMEETARNF
jgi:hypothetical protein